MSKVTVVMTAYNAMPYLPAAVNSIRYQTLQDWRMIVVDDGSDDATGAYLDSLDDERIEIIHQENQGQQVAASVGIAHSTAPYIARMDADDISEPTRLAEQVAFLDEHPDVGLVGSQIYRMGRSGRRLLASSLPTAHEQIYAQVASNQHAMVNPAVMFRRDLFDAVGGYWPYDIAEDWDMFLRIGEVSELANLDEPLLSYRFHPDSINGRRMQSAQLHNEYACERARARRDGREPPSLDRYRRGHRSQRWPGSWWFRMDCFGISQYRVAVAEISDGHPVRGRVRLAIAATSSPDRTFDRVRRVVRRHFLN